MCWSISSRKIHLVVCLCVCVCVFVSLLVCLYTCLILHYFQSRLPAIIRINQANVCVLDTEMAPDEAEQSFWTWTISSAALLPAAAVQLCLSLFDTEMISATAGLPGSFWTWTFSSAALHAAFVLDRKTAPAKAGQCVWRLTFSKFSSAPQNSQGCCMCLIWIVETFTNHNCWWKYQGTGWFFDDLSVHLRLLCRAKQQQSYALPWLSEYHWKP